MPRNSETVSARFAAQNAEDRDDAASPDSPNLVEPADVTVGTVTKKIAPVGYRVMKSFGVALRPGDNRFFPRGYESFAKEEIEMLAQRGAVLEPIWPK